MRQKDNIPCYLLLLLQAHEDHGVLFVCWTTNAHHRIRTFQFIKRKVQCTRTQIDTNKIALVFEVVILSRRFWSGKNWMQVSNRAILIKKTSVLDGPLITRLWIWKLLLITINDWNEGELLLSDIHYADTTHWKQCQEQCLFQH